jgi:hypothetical protein
MRPAPWSFLATLLLPLGSPGALSDHLGLDITYIREMAALSDVSVGGIAELPAAADSGWPVGAYAALARGAAGALAAVGARVRYTRRRRP